MMKNIFLLLVFSGLLNGLNAQNLPAYLPANGLVGWWPFNGNANDESGNGLSSIGNGIEFSADRFGNPNASIEFMNNGSVKTLCPQPLSPASSSEYSINLWFFKTIHNTGARIFLQYKEGSLGPAGTSNFDFFESGNEICPIGNVMFDHYPFFVYTCSPTIPSLNIWHNVTLIFSQTDHLVKLYLDGSYWFSVSLNNNFPGAGHLVFGNNATDEFPYVGRLDDIAIYNRALSQEEITQLYQAGNETSLSYQLTQEKLGNCPTSPVKLSVKTLPRIRTDSVMVNANGDAATAYGNILNDGGKTITRRGFCWSTSTNPTLSNSYSENGSGSGTFSGNITGLSSNSTFFVRAYAGTETEVWYGNELMTTVGNTLHTCGTPGVHNASKSYGTITDQDGNSYKTIRVGNQVWMAENLKTAHYRNGDEIPLVVDSIQWEIIDQGAASWYKNDSAK